MKAAYIKNYGDQSQLVVGELPKPQIQAGQVLVKTVASGVNPVDYHVRNGLVKDTGMHQLPLVLGWDVAGLVEAIGDNVEHIQPGDAVMAFTPISEQGTNSEYVAVDASLVVGKPSAMSFVEAAGLPLAGVTALQGINQANLAAGDTILIHGAAGAVGSFAVQIAKAKGLRVVATASKSKHNYVKSFGADEVYSYDDSRWQQANIANGALMSVDNTDVLKRTLKATKNQGWVISTFSEISEKEAEEHQVHFARMWVQNSGEDLAELVKLYKSGDLVVPIDSIFPLEQVVQAHQRSESHQAVGKIVLSVDATFKY